MVRQWTCQTAADVAAPCYIAWEAGPVGFAGAERHLALLHGASDMQLVGRESPVQELNKAKSATPLALAQLQAIPQLSNGRSEFLHAQESLPYAKADRRMLTLYGQGAVVAVREKTA